MYPSGIAPEPLARDLVQWKAALVLPIAAGAMLGIAIACLIGQAPWGDQALYLVAAGKALDGAQFGRDIVDVNPPLILWLSEIPVALARALGVLPQSAMQVLLGLLTATTLLWCLSLSLRPDERLRSSSLAWALTTLFLYGTTVHSWYYLGQREHILTLFLLPYLFLAWRWLEAASEVSRTQRLSAGLLAIAGCGLKPQHLLVVAAVEALLLAHTRPILNAPVAGLEGPQHSAWRSIRRPEIAAFIAGGAAYCLAIALLAPEYLARVVPFAYEAYLDRARVDWLELLPPLRILKILAVLAVWLGLRRTSRHRRLADVFIVAALAATAAYILQHKGYEYHFIPAEAFYILGGGIVVFDALGRWLRQGLGIGVLPPATARATIAAPLVAALIAWWLYHPGQIQRAATQWTDVRKTARSTITPHIPAGSTVFVLSSSVGGIYDHLLRQHVEWGSRFTALWMTQALLTRPALSSPREQALARWTLDSVTEDLQRYRPSLVLVDRCDDQAFPPCLEMGRNYADILGWFRRDPGFETAWARYERQRQVGPYDLWCATDDPRACQSVMANLKPEPAMPALATAPQ